MMEMVLLVLAGVLGGIGMGVLLMLPGRKADRTRVEWLQKQEESFLLKEQSYQQTQLELAKENERLKEKLTLTEEKWVTQKTELGRLQQQFTDQFQNLATAILEDKSRRFTETNRENIEKILQPLNKEIDEFRKKVDEAYHKEATERTVLERKIAELVQLNQQIRLEANNLTHALKGSSKAQGDWGEMILERILENSGLTKGREYFVQETLKDGTHRVIHGEQGNRMRPDVLICYPDGRKVVVDSKVSLTAYLNYCNAESEEERELALKNHMLSIRKHMEELAHKNYSAWVEDALDFVMMFIPNEASYVLAMQTDANLWSEAYQKRILLLSPANLIVSLKLIADLWSREYQNRNALEIADRGARLYDKCVAFLESFSLIGESLQKTQQVYEQTLNRLKTGHGNLISQTLKLKELGVRSKKGCKEIPAEFIDVSASDN